MQRDSRRSYRQYQDDYPSNSWSPISSSNTTTLPPISSFTNTTHTTFASRSRSSIASASTCTSASSPSSSHSYSSRSSGPIEPHSPIDGQPLLGPTRSMAIATHSPAHRSTSPTMAHTHPSSTDHYSHPYHHSTSSQNGRPVEDGSHLWGDGMKGIWNSLTGAPHQKPRSPNTGTSAKGEHLEPARPSDVEAATSIWDIPRDTVAMTMGFQGNYEDQSFRSQQVWQQQQQQMSSYSGAEVQQSHLGHPSSYNSMPAPSGLAGATALESTRPRGASDASTMADQHYARRPNYLHGRSSDASADASSNNGQWWSAESHAATEDPSSASHYGARRLQPPPLPETRSASRPAWSNSSSFEISGYEFPQSTLGKRQYDEEAMSGSAHGGVADASDSVARRYSLAPNMSFSRPSAPISGMMNGYRPTHSGDPRRPSLPSDPYGAQQQQHQQASAAQRAGYSNPSQWSPWSATTSHTGGVPGTMSTTGSSPNLSGWRDNGVMRYGIEAGYPSPSGMPAGDKRQQRNRSSSSASAVQQANTLANTPFHITTDIVLRAPTGSKMEDVYYDQHCEMRTGMADPPASDFEVENEEDRPRLQTDKLRFAGDLYTPRWVRGSGNAREAWCDRCESGNWLQLKNSQYWYDQVHKHGISSVSGLRFTAPTHLKVYADAAGTVEGKCHQCKEWVLICTAKRRRNFAAFFKHAHACHSYRKASAVGNGPYVEHNPGGHRNKKGNASPI
ncbi:uncharacterized protein UTRI_06152_B [Ustilago trichophora]|uniref:Transcription regulator Rua1 C-terminal domain-containing protein n=1 Tax=Ustilago trichophora TaxID=86804 RepID=A0A5C3EH55_9BASI|nr:uncharacterized protein UTRI_06152_B [Ustilago trichophora]